MPVTRGTTPSGTPSADRALRRRPGVDMAVTCQVSDTLPVLTVVSGLPSSVFVHRVDPAARCFSDGPIDERRHPVRASPLLRRGARLPRNGPNEARELARDRR